MRDRLYPTYKENQEFADFLSECSDDAYDMFLRQGIPPEISIKVRRSTHKPSQDVSLTEYKG